MITIVFGNQQKTDVVDMTKVWISKDGETRQIWVAELVEIGANVELRTETGLEIWKMDGRAL